MKQMDTKVLFIDRDENEETEVQGKIYLKVKWEGTLSMHGLE